MKKVSLVAGENLKEWDLVYIAVDNKVYRVEEEKTLEEEFIEEIQKYGLNYFCENYATYSIKLAKIADDRYKIVIDKINKEHRETLIQMRDDLLNCGFDEVVRRLDKLST